MEQTEFSTTDLQEVRDELTAAGFKEYKPAGPTAVPEDSEFIRFNDNGTVETILFTPGYLRYDKHITVEDECQSVEYDGNELTLPEWLESIPNLAPIE